MPRTIVLFITTSVSACTVLFCVGMLAVTSNELSIAQMMRDAATTAQIHPLYGLLSNLGILLWSVPASICLFVAIAARPEITDRTFGFLLSSALISGWLMIDDWFLFHEDLARRYFGLEEKWILLLFMIVFLLYILKFRKVILNTTYSLLVTAIGLFSISILVDSVGGFLNLSWKHVLFIEDALKWLGICFWCAYYVHVAYQILVGTDKVSGKHFPRAVPSNQTPEGWVMQKLLLKSDMTKP